MKRLFDRITRKDRKSASKARERLQLVLIHDRMDLSPGLLENLRDEINDVISRHIEIDSAAVRLEMTHEGRRQRLIADIPLMPSRRVGRS
ncbi:MAG: cell division topological specificity factor MinE [Anaerolineales bacterium]